MAFIPRGNIVSVTLRHNYLYAFTAQALSMLISGIIVLIVPRALGVAGYGQLQYFLLIVGYVSLFAIGINDGMYLRCGGKSFSEFEGDRTVKGEFAVLASLSFVECCFAFLALPCIASEESRAFVYQCFAIYVPLHLLNNYLGYLLQTSNRIKEYCLSTILEKCLCFCVVAIGIVLSVDDYRVYVIAYLVGKAVALVYSLTLCRNVLLGVKPLWKETLAVLRDDIPAGLKLTLSNLAAQLILGAARFFVDGAFGIEEFSQVSLAISLVNFFLVFINQAGLVLFPALRRCAADKLQDIYDELCGAIKVFLPLALIAYYPISWFVSWWLPSYTPAVAYLGILLSICYFDGKNNMIYSVFLKVKRGEAALMRANLITMAMSIASSAFFAWALRSLSGVLVSLLGCVVFRNVYLGRSCDKLMGKQSGNFQVAELSLAVFFVICNIVAETSLAFTLVVLASLAYALLQRQEIFGSLKRLLPFT